MTDSRDDDVVIFVHGLWMNGLELTWLRRQVAKQGYVTAQFTYRTVRRSIDENAARLHDFVLRQSATSVHFVGYSLGGLVTLRLLEKYSDIPHGRVVLMGSPVRGSQVAGRLREIGWDGPLLGRSGLHESRDVHWDGRRDLGVIAGTRNIGLGNVIKRLPKPNDGTVALVETDISGATDELQLPVTHASMMFSRDVAEAIVGFLRNGTFKSKEQGVGS